MSIGNRHFFGRRCKMLPTQRPALRWFTKCGFCEPMASGAGAYLYIYAALRRVVRRGAFCAPWRYMWPPVGALLPVGRSVGGCGGSSTDGGGTPAGSTVPGWAARSHHGAASPDAPRQHHPRGKRRGQGGCLLAPVIRLKRKKVQLRLSNSSHFLFYLSNSRVQFLLTSAVVS